MTIKKMIGSLLATAILAFTAFAQGQVIYNSVENPLDGNYPSYGYEATATSQIGDRVVFSTGTGRNLLTGTTTMSSWACESGHWNTNDCITTPGATFSHPITLNIHNVGAANALGTLVGSVTQTFAIPYRPSADPVNCTGLNAGKWYHEASATCFNGYATNVTFNLSSMLVPNQVIYGVAYNTTHYGDAPIGELAACYSTPAGCGYDSLNLAATSGVPTVGTNPAPADAYYGSTYAPNYCDAGAGGVGVYRLDAGCWAGFKPFAKFTAANVPTNKDQCKNGGWQTRTRPDGSSFRNQGDCIQYVNTGR